MTDGDRPIAPDVVPDVDAGDEREPPRLVRAARWLFSSPEPAPVEDATKVVLVSPPGRPRSRWDRGVVWIFAKCWLVIKNLTLVAGAVVLVLFLFPSFYRFAVRHLLPSSYYLIGSMGNPAGRFDDVPAMNVDLAPLDGAPPGTRLARLIGPGVMIARLGKDGYLIGRSDPAGGGDEYPGRSWQGGQCLFINDFKFMAVGRTARYKTDASGLIVMEKLENVARPGPQGLPLCESARKGADSDVRSGERATPQSPAPVAGNSERVCAELPKLGYRPVLKYDTASITPAIAGGAPSWLSVRASEIRERATAKNASASQLYVNSLLRDLEAAGQIRRVPTDASAGRGPLRYFCAEGKPGAVCPRIQIWAIGSAASCSINPFAH